MTGAFDARTRDLLRGVARHGSVSAAAAALGWDPSNATRHLRTAERRAGVALALRRRGGRGGNARLTDAGRRFALAGGLTGLAGAFDERAGTTAVRVAGRVLHVAGRVPVGAVELVLPPEAVALERGRLAAGRPRTRTSVRNRFPARVAHAREERDGVVRVSLTAGALRFDAFVVRGSVRDLRLRPGSRVVATVKAVALRVAPLP